MKDKDQIIRRLPHRYPFLMVDRVLEVEPGVRAVAVKYITGDSLFVSGAAGRSFPGVFILEAMAQVGAVAASPDSVWAGPDGSGEQALPGYLAAVNDARFLKTPRVGDRLVLTLEFVKRAGALVRFKGTAKIGDDVAAEAGLTFSVMGGY